MDFIESLKDKPCLKYAFIFHLLLGSMDTLHHLHVVIALGNSSALHAVWTGVLLLPLSIVMVMGYLYFSKDLFLWVFFAISISAIVFAGFYHGGWDHLIKVLGFLRIDSDYTDISVLLPADNFNLWVYEITGSIEFFLALVSAFFLYFAHLEKRDKSISRQSNKSSLDNPGI